MNVLGVLILIGVGMFVAYHWHKLGMTAMFTIAMAHGAYGIRSYHPIFDNSEVAQYIGEALLLGLSYLFGPLIIFYFTKYQPWSENRKRKNDPFTI